MTRWVCRHRTLKPRQWWLANRSESINGLMRSHHCMWYGRRYRERSVRDRNCEHGDKHMQVREILCENETAHTLKSRSWSRYKRTKLRTRSNHMDDIWKGSHKILQDTFNGRTITVGEAKRINQSMDCCVPGNACVMVVATAEGIMHDPNCEYVVKQMQIANMLTSRGTIYKKDLIKSFKNK